jgi:t-SNARE complex subunit (syntaxin)
LEGSIHDLHDLFIDIATYVDRQGDMVDSIEYGVDRARVAVEQGKREVVKGKCQGQADHVKKY